MIVIKRDHKKQLKAILRTKKTKSNPAGHKTIYCILRHVSQSGMSRRISFYALKGRTMICLDSYIEKLLGYKIKDHQTGVALDGVVVSGAGMDMGFHVVHGLSTKLYGHKHDQAYRLRSEWL